MYEDARHEWYDSHNAFETRDLGRLFPDFDLLFPWQAKAQMYDAPHNEGTENISFFMTKTENAYDL